MMNFVSNNIQKSIGYVGRLTSLILNEIMNHAVIFENNIIHTFIFVNKPTKIIESTNWCKTTAKIVSTIH